MHAPADIVNGVAMLLSMENTQRHWDRIQTTSVQNVIETHEQHIDDVNNRYTHALYVLLECSLGVWSCIVVNLIMIVRHNQKRRHWIV